MDHVLPPDASEEARLLTQVSVLANRFARRLVKAEDAADIAQDVVLKCLVRMRSGRWRIDTTLDALVASAVWRHHATLLGRSAPRRGWESQFVAERAAQTPVWMDPAAVVDEGDDEAFRERVLSELPARSRDAFLLVREQGASYLAVADRLGMSAGTVAAHVRRAEHHLAARLLGRRLPLGPPPSMTARGRHPSPNHPPAARTEVTVTGRTSPPTSHHTTLTSHSASPSGVTHAAM